MRKLTSFINNNTYDHIHSRIDFYINMKKIDHDILLILSRVLGVANNHKGVFQRAFLVLASDLLKSGESLSNQFNFDRFSFFEHILENNKTYQDKANEDKDLVKLSLIRWCVFIIISDNSIFNLIINNEEIESIVNTVIRLVYNKYVALWNGEQIEITNN